MPNLGRIKETRGLLRLLREQLRFIYPSGHKGSFLLEFEHLSKKYKANFYIFCLHTHAKIRGKVLSKCVVREEEGFKTRILEQIRAEKGGSKKGDCRRFG